MIGRVNHPFAVPEPGDPGPVRRNVNRVVRPEGEVVHHLPLRQREAQAVHPPLLSPDVMADPVQAVSARRVPQPHPGLIDSQGAHLARQGTGVGGIGAGAVEAHALVVQELRLDARDRPNTGPGRVGRCRPLPYPAGSGRGQTGSPRSPPPRSQG